MDLPSFFWATSTTGSCGFAIADSGMSAEPAAAATVVIKCLRESSPKRVMVPPAAGVLTMDIVYTTLGFGESCLRRGLLIIHMRNDSALYTAPCATQRSGVFVLILILILILMRSFTCIL